MTQLQRLSSTQLCTQPVPDRTNSLERGPQLDGESARAALVPKSPLPEFIDIISTSYPFTDGHLFPKLNKLAFYSHDFLEPREQIYMRKTVIETFVFRLNQNLGVTAKLESVLIGPEQDGLLETAALESDVWFWQAPKFHSFASMAWEKGRLHRQGTMSSDRL